MRNLADWAQKSPPNSIIYSLRSAVNQLENNIILHNLWVNARGLHKVEAVYALYTLKTIWSTYHTLSRPSFTLRKTSGNRVDIEQDRDNRSKSQRNPDKSGGRKSNHELSEFIRPWLFNTLQKQQKRELQSSKARKSILTDLFLQRVKENKFYVKMSMRKRLCLNSIKIIKETAKEEKNNVLIYDKRMTPPQIFKETNEAVYNLMFPRDLKRN